MDTTQFLRDLADRVSHEEATRLAAIAEVIDAWDNQARQADGAVS